MLTEHNLRERVGFRSPHLVLSLHLQLETTAGSGDTHKLRLRQMLKDLGPAAAVDAQAARRVRVEGGEIDVHSPEAGEGILAGIGAFLRYENPARITVPGF